MNIPHSEQAKSIVALAFRNGPIENLHAGKACPTCSGDAGYSHITDEEMKAIMKNAVDWVYYLLQLRDTDPQEYSRQVAWGRNFTGKWDDPESIARWSPRTK